MSQGPSPIPVVLFAYARPAHLARVLACLRENRVPLIHAFADGQKGAADAARVAETRALLRAIDWCEIHLTERTENFGLGRSVLAGVDEVAARYEAFIVWEDDLICVPGTYEWMCAALRHYANVPRVMSVSAWTHPRVTPGDVGDQPYFDARGDCWVWGAWARSWSGVSGQTALEKMRLADRKGISPAAYGADLPQQAAYEQKRNVWAVRWLYHHFLHGGICLRPPWSMVEHIGFDLMATNAAGSDEWANPPLREVPPQPTRWPQPEINSQCQPLWRKSYPSVGFFTRARRKIQREGRNLLKRILPESWRSRLRVFFGWRWFRGDYRTWQDARAASRGYDDTAIVAKVLAATLEVSSGRAAFERDGVLFGSPDPDGPLLALLQEIGDSRQGHLRVLDFGGSLGSNYWRHRTFFPITENLKWDVVEQTTFVEAGRRHLTGTPLNFFHNVESAQAQNPHDVLLCSCVLQYLEDPFQRLQQWSWLEIPFVLLNNLPLVANGTDRLMVQHVPPSIYTATYPVWFFNRETFIKRVGEWYEVVKVFESEAKWPLRWGMFQSTGLLLKRKVSP